MFFDNDSSEDNICSQTQQPLSLHCVAPSNQQVAHKSKKQRFCNSSSSKNRESGFNLTSTVLLVLPSLQQLFHWSDFDDAVLQRFIRTHPMMHDNNMGNEDISSWAQCTFHYLSINFDSVMIREFFSKCTLWIGSVFANFSHHSDHINKEA